MLRQTLALVLAGLLPASTWASPADSQRPAEIQAHPARAGWKLVRFADYVHARHASLEKSLLDELAAGGGGANSGFSWGANVDPTFSGFTAEGAASRIALLPGVGESAGAIGAAWVAWKETYHTAFGSAYDEGHALINFARTLQSIESTNAQEGTGYMLGTNKWSFMSADEFNSQLGLAGMMDEGEELDRFVANSQSAADLEGHGRRLQQAPVDWTAKVPPTGDQEDCESCWAWTATSVLAGHMAIRMGADPVRLSVQQLMMCADSTGSPQSCYKPAAGLAGQPAYAWLTRGWGNNLCKHDDVPYTGTNEPGCAATFASCGSWEPMEETRLPISSTHRMATYGGTSPTGPERSSVDSERAMALALRDGPLGIAVDMSCAAFQNYRSGVSTGCRSQNVNHAVTLVGFGTCASGAAEPPCDLGYVGHYWKVQNSWGDAWGAGGFIYAEYGANWAGMARYPTMVPLEVRALDFAHPEATGNPGFALPGAGAFGGGPELGGGGGSREAAKGLRQSLADAGLGAPELLGIASSVFLALALLSAVCGAVCIRALKLQPAPKWQQLA